jgi:hypothetical protein
MSFSLQGEEFIPGLLLTLRMGRIIVVSKKDYVKAAAIVQAEYTRARHSMNSTYLIAAFIELFEGNPRFDRARFVKACEPKE